MLQGTLLCAGCAPAEAGAHGAASMPGVSGESVTAPPPCPGAGFAAGGAPGVRLPPRVFVYARDVMLTQATVATVAVSHLSDEEAFESWPIITVGSHADLTSGSVPPGLVARDVSRRTPLGNPFKMGSNGNAYHLAPNAVHAYSQLLLDPSLDVDAVASRHTGLVPCDSRSQCRCTPARNLAIGELVSLVDGGAKLFLECCGLEDCHGLPLGLHVLDQVSATWARSGRHGEWKAVRHGVGAFSPTRGSGGPTRAPFSESAEERGCAASRQEVNPLPPLRAIVGNLGTITVQCAHGFVVVQGEDDPTLRPLCFLPDCVQGAFAYVRKEQAPVALPSAPSAVVVRDDVAFVEDISTSPPPSGASRSTGQPDAIGVPSGGVQAAASGSAPTSTRGEAPRSSALPSGFRLAAPKPPQSGSLAALKQRCPPTRAAARRRAVGFHPPWNVSPPSCRC